jgi:hypothetical protein
VLREVAALVGFRFYEALMAFLEERPEESFDEYRGRRREFIESLRS